MKPFSVNYTGSAKRVRRGNIFVRARFWPKVGDEEVRKPTTPPEDQQTHFVLSLPCIKTHLKGFPLKTPFNAVAPKTTRTKCFNH